MNEKEEFRKQIFSNIERLGEDKDLQGLSNIWIRQVILHKYAYNFSWLSRPIIQIPQDIVAVQELVWEVCPDVIIETGIAHGGSLILSASLLTLLDLQEAYKNEASLSPRESKRRVIGIDIDIREHNRKEIQSHFLSDMIILVEGSSIDPTVVNQIHGIIKVPQKVMVLLDSNHTHDHVLAELEAYAPLVSPDSYCIVFDTGIEDLPDHYCSDRSWGKGNNPKTAVWKFLDILNNEGRFAIDGENLVFEIDKSIEHKLLITGSPDGYLKRK